MSKRTKKNALLWNTGVDSEDDNFNSETSFEHQSKRCIWCGDYRRLVAGEKCCKKCLDGAFRVCKRCKRPFPSEEHFQIDAERCTSCAKKLAQERLRRSELKKKKVENLGTAVNLSTRKTHKTIKGFFPQESFNEDIPRAREQRRRKERSHKHQCPPKEMHETLKINKNPLYMRLFRIDESLPTTEENAYVAFPVYTTVNLSAKDGSGVEKAFPSDSKKDDTSGAQKEPTHGTRASKLQVSDGEESSKASSLASARSRAEDDEENGSNSWIDPSEDQEI